MLNMEKIYCETSHSPLHSRSTSSSIPLCFHSKSCLSKLEQRQDSSVCHFCMKNIVNICQFQSCPCRKLQYRDDGLCACLSVCFICKTHSFFWVTIFSASGSWRIYNASKKVFTHIEPFYISAHNNHKLPCTLLGFLVKTQHIVVHTVFWSNIKVRFSETALKTSTLSCVMVVGESSAELESWSELMGGQTLPNARLFRRKTCLTSKDLRLR